MNELTAKKPTVTIITPVFNEEKGLPLYESAVSELLLPNPDITFRVLFVDDGSTDRSWDVIESICARSPRFSGLPLARNFGADIAISAGIDRHVDGDAVVTPACDLQGPPEVVLEFTERWRRGAQVVWGTRRSRKESRARIYIVKFFLFLIRRYGMPEGSKFTTGSFLLLERTAVEAFRQFRERNRITFALVAWTGFDSGRSLLRLECANGGRVGLEIRENARSSTTPSSGFPWCLRLITLLEAVIFGISTLVAMYLVVAYWIRSVIPGCKALMATMTLFFGLLFMMVGVMGEYMYRIFIETTNRPLYFVSKMASIGNTRQPTEPR
jgi:glycosyltransferase involved in cell wall biosynthesis